MKGYISIYKPNDRRPNCVTMYVSADAILVLSTKEIVITEKYGEVIYLTERKTHPSERGWDVSD